MAKSMGASKKKPVGSKNDTMISSTATGNRGRPSGNAPENRSKLFCPYCAVEKPVDDFYKSSDPLVLTGRTVMCKSCAERIARRYDPRSGEFNDCTKASVKEALERLDKPFLENVWQTSVKRFEDHAAAVISNCSDTRVIGASNVWAAYMQHISNKTYNTMRWRDGDSFNSTKEHTEEPLSQISQTTILDNQTLDEEYDKNRRDVLRLLGYDPFAQEPELDKPMLYSQLLGFLDASGDNEDMMKTSSAISIVRGFLHQSKIDNMIAECLKNVKENKTGEIKALVDSKQKITSTISQLAEQSCLSLKHNKNATKGENTFTGKVRKLKELNLREAEVNAFDVGTCVGMQQVADISNASIMKQIRLDENDYAEMLGTQREKLVKMQQKANEAEEKARILLRENVDLKAFIAELGIDISDMCTTDTILYTPDDMDGEVDE